MATKEHTQAWFTSPLCSARQLDCYYTYKQCDCGVEVTTPGHEGTLTEATAPTQHCAQPHPPRCENQSLAAPSRGLLLLEQRWPDNTNIPPGSTHRHCACGSFRHAITHCHVPLLHLENSFRGSLQDLPRHTFSQVDEGDKRHIHRSSQPQPALTLLSGAVQFNHSLTCILALNT